MVYTVGMFAFLRTILILIILFYGVKLLLRYLLPFLLKWFINKQKAKFQDKHNQNTTGKSSTNFTSNKKSTTKTDRLGDYVEYEEIED